MEIVGKKLGNEIPPERKQELYTLQKSGYARFQPCMPMKTFVAEGYLVKHACNFKELSKFFVVHCVVHRIKKFFTFFGDEITSI